MTQSDARVELEAICAEIDSLTVCTAAPTTEPITSEGWYDNTDGTCSYWVWRSGRCCPVVQLQSRDDRDRWERLDQRGALLWIEFGLREQVGTFTFHRAMECANCKQVHSPGVVTRTKGTGITAEIQCVGCQQYAVLS